jgi:hypothetical protein
MAVVAGVAAAVVVAGVGAAFVFGFAPGGAENTAPSTESESTGGADTVALNFTIDDRSECGRTCRVVNATVTNVGNETVRNVRFAHELFSNGESGEPNEQVWAGTATVGTLSAGSSAEMQFEVRFGAMEGLAIQSNGGVLFSTAVTPAGNETFENDVQAG